MLLGANGERCRRQLSRATENPDEPAYTVSRAFLNEAAATGVRLHAPTIVIPEVASALLRSRVDPAAVADALADLDRKSVV